MPCYTSIAYKQGGIVFNKIWTKGCLHPATRLVDMGDLSPESLHLWLSPRKKTAYQCLLITRIKQHSLHISISPQSFSFVLKPWPYPAVNLEDAFTSLEAQPLHFSVTVIVEWLFIVCLDWPGHKFWAEELKIFTWRDYFIKKGYSQNHGRKRRRG